MRAVVQRVSSASVSVEGETVGAIGTGVVVLVGAGRDDDALAPTRLAAKVADLRIFPDDEGLMNLSLADIGGAALVISQFTLLADTSKGRRPSFVNAADPKDAAPAVDAVVAALRSLGIEVATGVFGASMRVQLVNEGPVTIVLDF